MGGTVQSRKLGAVLDPENWIEVNPSHSLIIRKPEQSFPTISSTKIQQ